MDFECAKCHQTISIPDKKVPKGKSFNIACPHCKQKNKFQTDAEGKPITETNGDAASKEDMESQQFYFEEVGGDDYDMDDKPFDFLEEGAETAILCEPNTDVRDKIREALANMGYHITEPKEPREALKQMRFHDFDMVVINERFGSRDPDMNHVLKYIDGLRMDTRRNMYVALLTERFRTQDNMIAFNKSVNIVINLNDVNIVEKILRKGISEITAFYRVFKETLLKLGRV
jgi:CheY-like chemotaxis protein